MVKNLRDADKFTIGNEEIRNPMVRIFWNARFVPLEMRKSKIQW